MNLDKYTLVKVSDNKFDIFTKVSNHSFSSLETGITYITRMKLNEYINKVMHVEIVLSTDNLNEISERIKQYDTERIHSSLERYLRKNYEFTCK